MGVCLEHISKYQLHDSAGSSDDSMLVEVPLAHNLFWIFKVDSSQVTSSYEPERFDVTLNDDAEVFLWHNGSYDYTWGSDLRLTKKSLTLTLSAEDLKSQYDTAREDYTKFFKHIATEADIYNCSVFNPDFNYMRAYDLNAVTNPFSIESICEDYLQGYGKSSILTDFSVIGTYGLRDAYDKFGVTAEHAGGILPFNILSPEFDSDGNFSLKFNDSVDDMTIRVDDVTLLGIDSSDCLFEDAGGNYLKFGMFSVSLPSLGMNRYGFGVMPCDEHGDSTGQFFAVNSGSKDKHFLDTAHDFETGLNSYFCSAWAFLKDKQFNGSLYDVSVPMFDNDGNITTARVFDHSPEIVSAYDLERYIRVQFDGDDTVQKFKFKDILLSNYTACAVSQGYSPDKAADKFKKSGSGANYDSFDISLEPEPDWRAFAIQLGTDLVSTTRVFLNGVSESQIRGRQGSDDSYSVSVPLSDDKFWSFEVDGAQIYDNSYKPDTCNILLSAHRNVLLSRKTEDGQFEFKTLMGNELKAEYDTARRNYAMRKFEAESASPDVDARLDTEADTSANSPQNDNKGDFGS